MKKAEALMKARMDLSKLAAALQEMKHQTQTILQSIRMYLIVDKEITKLTVKEQKAK